MDAVGTGPLKTGAKIGPVAAGDVDAQNTTAAFDWFRIAPDDPPADPGFDDEFEGDALDGCRWDKIKGWKSSNLAVAGGKLAITTFDADISGASNGPIQNLILQTPPPGDWTVETKMTAPLKDNWQLAGLLLHADDDHYVKYDVVADNAPGATPARRVELRYENGGNLTGPTGAGPDLPPPASPTDTWWLRLTKTGNTYTGAISADGEVWQQTPGSVTVALTNPGLGADGDRAEPERRPDRRRPSTTSRWSRSRRTPRRRSRPRRPRRARARPRSPWPSRRRPRTPTAMSSATAGTSATAARPRTPRRRTRPTRTPRRARTPRR